jgi:hypothetical protein
MRCLDDGELRAWIDGAAAEQATVGAHVDGCAACRAAAGELRGNAQLAAAAIGVLAPARPLPAARVEAARERVAAAVRRRAAGERVAATPRPAGASGPAGRGGRRGWLAAAAAGLLALALVATPTGRSAASRLLEQFRSQRFAVVTFDPAQAGDLAATLQQLGTVRGDLRGVEPQPVATPAAASRLMDFPVALPDAAALPSGVDTRPRIMVTPARQLRFTLDAAQVGRYLAAHGRAAAAVPAGLDGATLLVEVPAATLLEYVAADGGPRLVVGQSRQLTASVVGGAVPLETLREFLLDLPGLPPQTVRQLRAIGDWRDTLPLPVPADRIDWRATTIHGAPGLVLGDRGGLGSAVIWQRDGRIYGVAGVLRPAHVLRVAESLD